MISCTINSYTQEKELVKKTAILTALIMITSVTVCNAKNILESLDDMLEVHPELRAAQMDLVASEKNKSAKSRDLWSPRLHLRYRVGPQWYESASGDVDTDMTAQQFEARIDQRVWDFGKSSAEIGADKFIINQSEMNLDSVEQRLIMQALDSVLQVQRAESLLKFASQSQLNILEQTEMENILVEEGRGFSSNVLQAKAQLAGAEARLNSAQSDLEVAYAKLYAMFEDQVDELDLSYEFIFPENFLPSTLDEAIAVAVDENPRIKLGHYRTETLNQKVIWEHRKAYYPDVNLVGRMARDNDFDGAIGTRSDDSIVAEVSFPFNLGLSGHQHKGVALYDAKASERQEEATMRDVVENTKIAWRRLATSRENCRILESKVRIAAEFLRLAQEERQSGRRSLLEVLTAETTLFDAKGELAAALTSRDHSTFDLLFAMGKLNMEYMHGLFQSPGPDKQEESKTARR